MFIKHDFSYIRTNESKLIDSGYGTMGVHSIHFDRYFSEEQKEKNRELAETLTREEWNKHCGELGEELALYLYEILNVFVKKYNIHQVSAETSTMEHYRSDWDLYFYSNKGWNGKEYMDFFNLSFNGKRSAEQNMKLAKEIVSMVELLEYENICCRVQYIAIIDNEKVSTDAKAVCENLLGKFINYNYMTGKIKVVSEADGNKEYGFFKKNAKNRYYPISYTEILVMSI